MGITIRRRASPSRGRGALPRLRPAQYPSRTAPLVLPHPSRPGPHLPNEILALIIGHIPLACGYSEGHGAQGSQWKGLARLCLVAASFLEPSRKLLYRRLDVPSQTSQDSPSRSAAAKEAQVAVVTETPHLASLVRTITTSRPTSEDLLKTLLATTHHLNDIFLWGNSDSVAPSLLATSPHLTSLSLTSSDDFLVWDLLRSQTSLKSLSIKVTLGVPSGPPPTFELKELELNFFSAGPRAASNAAYLAFATQSSTMSMTTLEFCMGKDAEIVYDLAPFVRLESLHIHTYSQPLPLNLPKTIRPLSLLRLTLDRNIFDSPLFSPILAALPPTSPRSSRLPRPNPSLTS